MVAERRTSAASIVPTIVKFVFAAVRLAVAAAVLPYALDWRSPFLTTVRPWAFLILVAVPLAVAAGEIWLWRSERARRTRWRLPATAHMAIAAVALFAASCTLFLEARFQWMRHEVMHADPRQLERLGHHVIVGYRDADELRALVERRAISGVFLTSHNVRERTIGEVREIVEALQATRARQNLPPLWIATDQEGGAVSRLSPPLARSGSLSGIVAKYADEKARSAEVGRFAAEQARELSYVGVNLNFAPVVDINHHTINPKDRLTRIYARAIAADPQVVMDVAGRYCATLWQGGIRCTLKHFPGLGRVFEDTHREDAQLNASIADLAASDWIPFRTLMQDGTAFTMLGHARLTAVDPDRPASFSRAVVGDLIRRQWQHEGVLITDDFCMGAVTDSRAGVGQAAVEALNAGVDLILVSYDPAQYYPVMHALLRAYRNGSLQQEALERSEIRLGHALEPFRRTAGLGPR
jgi:beta-N-acetylhexosaminidase